MYSYAENMAIIARVRFNNVLRDRISYALRVFNECCSKMKYSVMSDETSEMIFARKHKTLIPGHTNVQCRMNRI